MEGGYMILAKDGKEHGPIDRDTIQAWYTEGRVDRNSRVWQPGGHRFRLHEIFDLTIWSNPGLISQTSLQSNGEPEFVIRSGIDAVPNERTPGMLAAAVLLLGSGIIELLALAAITAQKLNTPSDARFTLGVAAVADLVLSVGLFRGNQRFRGWGLGRAAIGGAFLLISGIASGPSLAQGISLGFQVLMCAGLVALLTGESPSRIRVGAGVAAVLIAWSGIITTESLAGFKRAVNEQREFAGYTIPAADFTDDKLGVSVTLPQGWALLAEDNPYVRLPDAAMIAVHDRSGCIAALLVEPDLVQTESVDGYLGLVLANRKQNSSSLVELGRSDVNFGGNAGKRLETSWSAGGNGFRGFTTACKAGTSYYLLTGWCLDEYYETAFQEYQSLEAAFRVAGTKSSDAEVVTHVTGSPSRLRSSKH
jgi:hypothetical protein